VFNEWWAQNGDGIDISACRNVVVYRCTVSAGDDGICMKSSGRPPAPEGAALENVIVAECTVYHAHGGFVIGSNTDGGMRNVWATRCTFIGTDVGLRFKSGLGRGGLVHDIYVSDIAMKDIVNEAILFDTFYENVPASAAARTPKNAPATEKMPEFRDFSIRNVICHGAGTAIGIAGQPDQPVHRITIENAFLATRRGLHASHAADITLRRVKLATLETPAVVTENCTNVRLED
jgi:polygalacturonase